MHGSIFSVWGPILDGSPGRQVWKIHEGSGFFCPLYLPFTAQDKTLLVSAAVHMLTHLHTSWLFGVSLFLGFSWLSDTPLLLSAPTPPCRSYSFLWLSSFMRILECVGYFSSGLAANIAMDFWSCYLLQQSVFMWGFREFQKRCPFDTSFPESCSLVSEKIRLIWKGF